MKEIARIIGSRGQPPVTRCIIPIYVEDRWVIADLNIKAGEAKIISPYRE